MIHAKSHIDILTVDELENILNYGYHFVGKIARDAKSINLGHYAHAPNKYTFSDEIHLSFSCDDDVIRYWNIISENVEVKDNYDGILSEFWHVTHSGHVQIGNTLYIILHGAWFCADSNYKETLTRDFVVKISDNLDDEMLRSRYAENQLKLFCQKWCTKHLARLSSATINFYNQAVINGDLKTSLDPTIGAVYHEYKGKYRFYICEDPNSSDWENISETDVLVISNIERFIRVIYLLGNTDD